MGRRHIWKPRQVIRALRRLGFTQDKRRGKGDHIWFYKRVTCLHGEKHTMVTMVDPGVDDIPYGTMNRICDAIALDDEQLYKAYKGEYTEEMYVEYLSSVPKNRLLPPAMRRGS